MASHRPVVVVLGATGAGKSKLAIELGRAFNGEIISADSMQVYKGLDVITNKVTAEEQAAVPHHLISYLCPFRSPITVTDFRNAALPLTDRLLEAGKLPIIVGGTNYYIESLLWNFLINHEEVEKAKSAQASPPAKRRKLDADCASDARSAPDCAEATEGGEENEKCTLSSPSSSADSKPRDQDQAFSENRQGEQAEYSVEENKEGKFAAVDTPDLYAQLCRVDETSSRKIHPHNRRKIVRALQVYETYKIPMSSIHEAQRDGEGDDARSGPLRFQHTCIFWVQSDQAALDARLDKRVDQMVANGLVKELHEFKKEYEVFLSENHGSPDMSVGIFQSIGLKEFKDYLALPSEEQSSEKGKRLLEEGLNELKIATRRYARRQIKWIKNRFLKRVGSAVPDVYGLDTTNVDLWESNVRQPAEEILAAVLKGDQPQQSPLRSEERRNVHVFNKCDVCGGKVFTTQLHWEEHLRGKKHKGVVHRLKKLEGWSIQQREGHQEKDGASAESETARESLDTSTSSRSAQFPATQSDPNITSQR